MHCHRKDNTTIRMEVLMNVRCVVNLILMGGENFLGVTVFITPFLCSLNGSCARAFS
jgi:hypothetical protein